jgi:hypothetical protein
VLQKENRETQRVQPVFHGALHTVSGFRHKTVHGGEYKHVERRNQKRNKMNDSSFFEKLVSEVPQEFVQVAEFFKRHFSKIRAERYSKDFDTLHPTVNVSFLFKNGFLASVTKPVETMDDGFVAFNFYENKELLIAEIADIGLVSEFLTFVSSNQ